MGDRCGYLRAPVDLARVLILLSLSLHASAENCGNVPCPSPQFEPINIEPASVLCDTPPHPPCNVDTCCVAAKCTDDPTALLAASNMQAFSSADIEACDAVNEGACIGMCISAGYRSPGTPTLVCKANADNTGVQFAVNDPCVPILCDTASWIAAVDALTGAIRPDAVSIEGCRQVLSAACGVSCAAGYYGNPNPTLSCVDNAGNGQWVLSGQCSEHTCFPYTTSPGTITAAANGCTIDMTAQVTDLKPVSKASCELDCANGYTKSGDQTLACTPTNFQPATSHQCSENRCQLYTLLDGMVANTGTLAPPNAGVQPCTITSGGVNTLTAVTNPTCALTCGTGYQLVNAAGAAATDADKILRCTLASDPMATMPVTTLRCAKLTCTTLNAATLPTGAVTGNLASSTAQTGDLLTIGSTNTGHIQVLSLYSCTGTPEAICSSAGARYDVVGLTCAPFKCGMFTDFAQNNIVPTDLSACDEATDAACMLTCATGYTGAPTLSCTGSGTFTDPTGSWVLGGTPCTPISCTLASVPSAVHHFVPPTDISMCDTVIEGACTVQCVDGYTYESQSLPTQISCASSNTWTVTNPCVAKCSDSSEMSITDMSPVPSTVASPTQVDCSAGSGYLLRSGASNRVCSPPPAMQPADPSRDCSAALCCVITCGHAPCSVQAGFDLLPNPNTIRCAGADASSCTPELCCTRKTCAPLNKPSVTGAVVSCTSATEHGTACTVTPQVGYLCSGSVTCTPASSETESYESTLTCMLAQCPPNSNTPPVCGCNQGYAGSPTWNGAQWTHTCVPQACQGLTIANSREYETEPLTGVVDETVAVLCKSGYEPTAATTTCNGATQQFDVVECRPLTCPPTSVANSLLYAAAGSIVGQTGQAYTVDCVAGFVGTGTGCPDACTTTCDGSQFNPIVCQPVDCPEHSSTVGVCACDAGYSGTPSFDPVEKRWTHVCKATCGLHTCVNYLARSPAASYECDGTTASSCTDQACCAGVITSPMSLTVTEDGTAAEFYLQLVSKPATLVSIALISSNGAEGTVEPPTLAFTANNWNERLTATVVGVDDDVDDGEVMFMISATASSTDPDYGRLGKFADISVTNLDNDSRDVLVSPRTLTTSEPRDDAVFTVVLMTRPTADVSIPVAVGPEGVAEGTVSTGMLVFTTANWNIKQTIRVTPIDDDVADGSVTYPVNLGPCASTDAQYSDLQVDFVSVNNQDNDQVGIVVEPTTGLITSESGTQAQFSVRLNSKPVATVQVPIYSSNTMEGTVSVNRVSFDPTNWNTPQVVVVAGVDDKIDDGDVSYFIVAEKAVSSDPRYHNLEPDDVGVKNRDDDVSGYNVVPTTSLVTTEAGGRATFTVSLKSQPTAMVRVVPTTASPEATFEPEEIVFTNANFELAQTIQIVGADDNVQDGNKQYTVSITGDSADPNYDGQAPNTLELINSDDDTAGVDIAQDVDILETSEDGAAAKFSVRLLSQPVSPVILRFAWDAKEGLVDPSFVTVSPSDWDRVQEIDVLGVDDNVFDGTTLYSITTTIETGDPVYNTVSVRSISVRNLDNDRAGITVQPTTTLRTTEYGGTDTFTIQLQSQPVADVTIGVASLDPTEGTLSSDSLTFTTNNYRIPKTVTVTGVQDAVQDDDITYSARFTVMSGDVNYNNFALGDKHITNLDDDTPGYIYIPLYDSDSDPVLRTTEDGGIARFSVQLRSQPSGPVQLTMATDSTEATLMPTTITFLESSWRSPQTVIITGIDDDEKDGDVKYDVIVKQTVSTDPNYNGRAEVAVQAVNADKDVASFRIFPEMGLRVSEDGTEAEFSVTLTSRPVDLVELLVTSDTREIVTDPTSVVFTADDWALPKIVRIKGVDDNVDDGDVQTMVRLNAFTSADPNYVSLPVKEMVVTNEDNDASGIIFQNVSAVMTTEGGGYANFSVRLATVPKADVQFQVTSSDVGEGRVSPGAMIFTAVNWNRPQYLIVTGQDDDVNDRDQTFMVRPGLVMSDDPLYASLVLPEIPVVNKDDDSAGIDVSGGRAPDQRLTTSEDGDTANVTVRLTSKPLARVSFTLASNNPNEGTATPAELIFDPQDWNVAQTVVLMGVDDNVDDGDIEYMIVTNTVVSEDTRYDGLDAPNIYAVNQNNDRAAVIVSDYVGLVTTEDGDKAFFTLSLASQPTFGVTIKIESLDATEGLVSPTLMLISPATWNQQSTVYITGIDDDIDDDETKYTISLSTAFSADLKYDKLALPVQEIVVTNKDNDVPGIVVAPTANLETSEEGDAAMVTVTLTTMPSATVTITVRSSDDREGAVNPRSMVFAPEEWDMVMGLTVAGQDDDLADGNQMYTVSLIVTSADPMYDAMPVAPLEVMNLDNDTPNIMVHPLAGLFTTEQGGAAEFTVSLSTQPTAPVRVGLSVSQFTEAELSMGMLVFDQQTWAVKQTVTVQGLDDAVDDGDREVVIATSAAQSDDPDYDGFNAEDVLVINEDDDTAGILVVGDELTTSEDGIEETFTVVLTSEPTDIVSISVASKDPGEGLVTSSMLVFQPKQWNTTQTVTVAGQDDNIFDANVPYVIALDPSSNDNLYHTLKIVDVIITNRDNDIAAIYVSETEGVVTTEDGGVGTFTVWLSSRPSESVTVRLESSDVGEGIVLNDELVFAPEKWNTKQTVSVRGVDDAVQDGNKLFTVRILAAQSGDGNYNGYNTPDVLCTNSDNDVASIVVSTERIITTEGGAPTQFTVSITSEPTAGVYIEVESSDLTEGVVSPRMVLFTREDWKKVHKFNVSGVYDSVIDEDRDYTILLDVFTADAQYANLPHLHIPAVNLDVFDECFTTGRLCVAGGQRCVDRETSPTSLRDFTCECAGSATGSARGVLATCVAEDECVLNGPTCWSAGQMCVDPNAALNNDWRCECVPPQMPNTSVAAAGRTAKLAQCILDECQQAITPGNTAGLLCELSDQDCVDLNTNPNSLLDWRCVCRSPLVGFADRTIARCDHKGECEIHHTTCGSEQTCDDPDLNMVGDWICSCKAPAAGIATAEAAQCEYDECEEFGKICAQAGQECIDRRGTGRADWRCVCPSDSEGFAIAQAAVCTIDECEDNMVCSSRGQLCFDPNTGVGFLNDWVCKCIAPSFGVQVGGPAQCTLSGECVAYGDICFREGQNCVDPSLSDLNDWMCVCIPPYEPQFATAAPAVCVYDECTTKAHICSMAGQMCTDPNSDPTSLDDWFCSCIEPATGRAMTQPAECTYVGACQENSEVCTSVGQACIDDLQDEDMFTCRCVPPQEGERARDSAVCILNECRENGKVCASAGQLCVDPDTSLDSLLDWRCECPEPAKGRARASAASCRFGGECVIRSSVCTSVGQTCVDPTPVASEVDDWECRCIPPATGSMVMAPATCVYDECSDFAGVCTEARQSCEDPNPSPMVLDDWMCRCVGSRSTGTQVGGPATCILDECLYHTICRDVGQLCVDPDKAPSSVENWYCICPEPASGTSVGSPATCTYTGKCATEYRVCTEVGQSCIDNINNGEWECACVAPQTGRQKAGPATCVLDECNTNGETCLRRGQMCMDQNVGVSSLGDWRCSCAGDSSGTAVGQAATCVYTGECVSRSYVCEAAGQSCEDPSGSRRLGDWACVCVPPFTGKATGEPAECFLDECDVYSYICTRFGQKCTDPNHSPEVRNDWQCSCIGSSATGVMVGGPATCIFDECMLHSDVCRDIGQVCVDVDKSPSSIGDWRCTCVAPSTGFAVAKQATCTHVGECARFASICINAGQSCTDPDIFVSGNWKCQCLRPYSGEAVGRPAECRVDECIGNAATCNRMGQTCHDPSNTENDWVCNCIAPAVGRGLQEVASCEYQGECAEKFAICIPLGQTCVDPDENTPNDWRCVCPPPMTGAATGTVATCLLDECVVHSPTCTDAGQRCIDPNKSPVSTGDWQCLCEQSATGMAVAAAAQCFYKGDCADFHQTCTDAGQACHDPDLGSAGNWECVCIEPQLGKATRKAASCSLDECKLYSSTCTQAGQRCVDTNPSPSSTGDWRCECIGSSSGMAVATAATCKHHDVCVEHARTCLEAGQACFALTDDDWYCLCPPPFEGQERRGKAKCILDECNAQDTCESFGQTCVDQNTSTMSLNNWICKCLEPDENFAVMTAARCEFQGECVQNSIVCTAAGQTCKDPNPTRQNDWECRCVSPELGVATGKPATCELDECIKNDLECARYGQLCHDPYPLAASKDDWVCMCDVIYSKGVNMLGPVSCTVDECERDGQLCYNDGQMCHDPDDDPSALDNWVCTCPGSGSTRALQLAACETHYVGQCKNNFKICTDAGQACQDNADTDDWSCVCVEPMVGAAAGAVVSNCFYDECAKYGHVCTNAGQTCHDPAKEQRRQGDWMCMCGEPLTGTAVATVAECLYSGECAANGVVCTMMGQTCYDPNLNRLGDWQCLCVYPQTGDPAKAEPAACELDECVVHKKVCTNAGQVCFDRDRSISSTSDWMCSCIPPARGSATASTALCTYMGECKTHALVCSDAGQTCYDPSPAQGDWECRCPQPSTGREVAQPVAVCVLNECDTEGSVCRAVGQECDDLDESLDGTWVCRCVSPASGVADRGPAICTWQGECQQFADVCVAAGQTCKDPDVGVDGDWNCVCLAPFTGEAKGKPADCLYDECVQNGDVCIDEGQVCHDVDPSPASLSDWVCKCPPPFYGAERSMPAVCKLDECIENGQLCTNAAQRCVDPEPTKTDDWVCVCVAPQSGRAVGAPAACDLDECATYGYLCTSVGQMCEDPDVAVSSIGDWMCMCQGSGLGEAVAQAATCTYPGECAANHEVCTSKGQACRDPDPTKSGDWECNCLAPMTGIATGAPATCNLDECGLHRGICSAAQQDCVDPNLSQNSVNDWMCVCSAGGGSAVTRAATCVVDECLANGVECLRFGQQCNDPNTSPTSLRDWACSCVGSAVGTATAGPAACEYQNECVVHSPVCVHAGQACYDPNVAVVDDWLCICVEPSIGEPARNGPAMCTVDECTRGGGVACIAEGQTCTDMVTKSATLNDFICECSGSSKGIRTAAVAVCDWVGECAANAAVCTNEGKTCYDPNPENDGDWYCSCVHPAVLDPNGSGVCMTDECLLHGATCTSAGQDCVDPNMRYDAVGDWMCACRGTKGSAVGRAARCMVDECKGNAVCANSGQMCKDANTSADSLGDWSCHCVGSAEGTAVAGVASCKYSGECEQQFSTCTSVGQACLDPSDSANDWQCFCIAPATGRAVAQAASCELDECMENWNVCTAHGQECEDSNKDSRSLDDWYCHCRGTSLGSAMREVASCTFFGECLHNKDICLANGQACFDPSPNDHDWICKCVSPLVGFSTSAFVSECNVDECLVMGQLCTSHGQICNDPNKAADSLGDWICDCVGNGEGSATAAAATCTYKAECIANAHICTAAGQYCEDETGLGRVGDWSCNCVSPYSGRANTKAALCSLDECEVHGDECESLEQTCEDPNIDVESLDDWMCKCVGVGITATAKPALCTYDECVALNKNDECNAAGQACVDPNPVAMFKGDWTCQCVGSAMGQAVAKVATCIYHGECVNEGAFCAQAGQGCVDPSEAVGDWECMCIAPSEKMDTLANGAAVCRLDECSTAGALCKEAGQLCEDTDHLLKDSWLCRCHGVMGSAAMAVADCVYLDECATEAPLCVRNGQSCIDPNPQVADDWRCVCVPPAAETLVTNSKLSACNLDECVLHGTVCTDAGQVCRDINTMESSKGDWYCQCTGSGVGQTQGQVSKCAYPSGGGCSMNAFKCSGSGQACNDTLSGYMCSCVDPRIGTADGQPALCRPAGECARYKYVCEAAGQVCEDRSLETSGDWTCRCQPPLRGSAVARAVDECVEGTEPAETYARVQFRVAQSKAQVEANEAGMLAALQRVLGLQSGALQRSEVSFDILLEEAQYDDTRFAAGVAAAINGRKPLDIPRITSANLVTDVEWVEKTPQGRHGRMLQATATGTASVGIVGGTVAWRRAWLNASRAAEAELVAHTNVQAVPSTVTATAPRVHNGIYVEDAEYEAQADGSTQVTLRLVVDDISETLVADAQRRIVDDTSVGGAGVLAAAGLQVVGSSVAATATDCGAGNVCEGNVTQRCVDPDGRADGSHQCVCNAPHVGEGWNQLAVCSLPDTPAEVEVTPAPPTMNVTDAPELGAAEDDDDILGMSTLVFVIFVVALVLVLLGLLLLLCRMLGGGGKGKDDLGQIDLLEDNEQTPMKALPPERDPEGAVMPYQARDVEQAHAYNDPDITLNSSGSKNITPPLQINGHNSLPTYSGPGAQSIQLETYPHTAHSMRQTTIITHPSGSPETGTGWI